MQYENKEVDSLEIKEQIYRYLNFWPFYLFFILISLTFTYLYLRSTPNVYEKTAKIKINDQEKGMALPTSMTIFNRSMINLENEIEVLSSSKLTTKLVKDLKLQYKYYNLGFNKLTESVDVHWIDGYEYELKDVNNSLNTIYEKLQYDITIKENGLDIVDNIGDNDFSSKKFNTENSSLPFYFSFNEKNIDKIKDRSFRIEIYPLRSSIEEIRGIIKISAIGSDSDIVKLSVRGNSMNKNALLINTLIDYFDRDGIKDRQLSSKRTIDFVNKRISSISSDLESVEQNKQNFKIKNNLFEISETSKITVINKTEIDNKIIKIQTQIYLIDLLIDNINLTELSLLPINIGIENDNINTLSEQYNELILLKNSISYGAGDKNPIINIYNDNLRDIKSNIIISLNSFRTELELNKSILSERNVIFNNTFSALPKNEKTLRIIEREQSIKEAIFILLLQKREEASINFAVTSPSIKVIDYAVTSMTPISPNKKLLYLLAISIGFAIPFTFLIIRFSLDTKIHTKSQLLKKLDEIPVIGEIPFVKDDSLLNSVILPNSRDVISESVRMMLANLKFILYKEDAAKKSNVILVTSTIKGEGKTLVSVNTASLLSNLEKKVLLVGADLRNPQIHKFLNLNKDKTKGLADFIYNVEELDYKKFLVKQNNLDILLSGSIPPNPTQLLSSAKFAELISQLRNDYDYVIIDSAPCLLVSDTFEISKFVDASLYVVRSNYSQIQLCDFINECKVDNKISNINIVLNGVGSSHSYGYKYGYQYGYKYGYKYGYNYGYSYGYSEDKS